MKLSVEIKDNKFIYSYEIGESKHASETHLCADTLVVFTKLIEMCSGSYKYQHQQWEREMLGKAYAEKQARGTQMTTEEGK